MDEAQGLPSASSDAPSSLSPNGKREDRSVGFCLTNRLSSMLDAACTMKGSSTPPTCDVLPELLDYVFAQLPAVLGTTLVIAPLAVGVVWVHFSPFRCLGWLGALLIISLFRVLLYVAYRHSSVERPMLRRWQRLYVAGAVAAGLVWGATPLLFFSKQLPQINIFLALVLGGIVSGASSSMAPFRMTMRLFIGLTCLPITGLFLMQPDRLHQVMGLLLMTYGVGYLYMSDKKGRLIVESLKLRHENLREIDVRKRAEQKLRAIQKDLESAVVQRTSELQAANEELSQEIAERLEAESKQRESELRYRSLVETCSDWIWEVDRDGVYTYSSPTVASMLGVRPEELLGKVFSELMHPDEAGRVKAIFDAHVHSGEAFSQVAIRCVHRDGTERILETSGEPVWDEAGVLVGYRGIDRDITLRVKHEEEARKVEHLHSLGLLAGGIAHDFNNLLTSVFVNIDLARLEIADGSEAATALDASTAAIEQARKLTGQLLTFSRGGHPMMEATSVRELVRDSGHLALSGAAVKCEYDLPQDLWMADVDPGQIWQVLNNLFTNAREAMPQGGLLHVAGANETVTDDSALPLEPGPYVRISVQDRGVGIAEENLGRVFDPYFSTKQRGSQKGTGIGLAVCHSVIKRHRGHIRIASKAGHGTTVTVYLPAVRAGVPAVSPVAPESEVRTPACRVLLLEDDEAVKRAGVRLLRRLGHHVVAVGDGVEALDVYARSQTDSVPFDLVLLDLTIRGGMGGRETLGQLRKLDPEVVAVVTSGYADNPVIADYARYGFQGALVKPYSLSSLRKMISWLIFDRSVTGSDPSGSTG